MTANTRSVPSASAATLARYAESTPPLKPRSAEPRSRNQATSARSFSSADRVVGTSGRTVMLQRNRDLARSGGGSTAHRAGFMIKQPALTLDTAAEPRERSIGADHTMTRHDDHQRIPSVRGANCAHCFRISHAPRQLGVADRFAEWDDAA